MRTTPLKASIIGKRKQTRKSNEDKYNNSELIREEVGETPSYSSQEKTEVPKKKNRKIVTPPKASKITEDDKNEDQEGLQQDEVIWEDTQQFFSRRTISE